jgi:hypothetical protein
MWDITKTSAEVREYQENRRDCLQGRAKGEEEVPVTVKVAWMDEHRWQVFWLPETGPILSINYPLRWTPVKLAPRLTLQPHPFLCAS